MNTSSRRAEKPVLLPMGQRCPGEGWQQAVKAIPVQMAKSKAFKSRATPWGESSSQKMAPTAPPPPNPVYIHGKPLANKEYVMFTKGWETQVLWIQFVDSDVGMAPSTTSGLHAYNMKLWTPTASPPGCTMVTCRIVGRDQCPHPQPDPLDQSVGRKQYKEIHLPSIKI